MNKKTSAYNLSRTVFLMVLNRMNEVNGRLDEFALFDLCDCLPQWVGSDWIAPELEELVDMLESGTELYTDSCDCLEAWAFFKKELNRISSRVNWIDSSLADRIKQIEMKPAPELQS